MNVDENYKKNIKVLNILKSFVNEEVKSNLRDIKTLLNEVSKKKVLIDKLGLNDESATILDRLCGPLAVWMTNKLLDYQEAILRSWSDDPLKNGGEITKKDVINKINTNNLIKQKSQTIQSIMDYIRVGLNGDNSTIKNLSFQELVNASLEWHESLEVGQGEINYVETNPIVVDFRDENGLGFYWTDLQTNASDEECKRMGHCGRTAYGNTIFSLREVKKIPGTKYTINKSHLTASIGDGYLRQLKGSKNSKPDEKYHPYILPLFDIKTGEEGYLITSFGSEYASSKDFKIADLTDEDIKKLYSKRPELFNTRVLKKQLEKLGLIELPKLKTKFILDLKPDELDSYIKGDWTVRKYKKPNGYTVKIGLFESILSGDMWDMWDNYDVDWKGVLEYYIDKDNESKIIELIKKMAGEDYDEELGLEDSILEYDNDNEIRNAISSSINDCEAQDYHDHLYNTLKSAIEEYGPITKMDDTGVTIEIDNANYLDDIDDDNIEDLLENCNEDPSCMFTEMASQGDIEKPKYSIDDRWTPDCDKQNFNSNLNDRLGEVEYQINKTN